MIKPGRRIPTVAADVFSVSNAIETRTAAALASIAMLEAAEPQMQNGPA